MSPVPFWERPEVVERFASRPPDDRMVRLLSPLPRTTRILDLGCAAGRNTEWMAREGFDVYACDGSEAMVAYTRNRLRPYLPEEELARRVIRCRMDDLSAFPDAFFDVVVALGIYQQAEHAEEWHRAVAETARVLRSGGHLLVQHFAVGSQPWAGPLREVEPWVFEAEAPEGERRRFVLLDETTLNAWMDQHGLSPEGPARLTTRPTEEGGFWHNLHAHYRKRDIGTLSGF
ncbi:MAG: class I SAM-dependent methyltransferase [Armatimonadota bacterium]|nr:class I SAM-dependent methyltransferase [Armatimonadota bacterium]MDR7444359.1 class I SAM-dependent methyltransferase [Armatimonadota bacterium]MDR7569650.1 class I SAM-dependent methyltransferase [Armatimonadota bacterium]MDR7614846.1 class I SAM-dependent methyltransferase [Armatimonadota bacterium]